MKKELIKKIESIIEKPSEFGLINKEDRIIIELKDVEKNEWSLDLIFRHESIPQDVSWGFKKELAWRLPDLIEGD